jgi:hypothetical protein
LHFFTKWLLNHKLRKVDDGFQPQENVPPSVPHSWRDSQLQHTYWTPVAKRVIAAQPSLCHCSMHTESSYTAVQPRRAALTTSCSTWKRKLLSG